MLEKSYNKYYDRPAKDPEIMLKLLVLQYLYNLSDEKVIEEASLKTAFMWFLGINPEEELLHPSLLSVFRVHRLQDVTLDEIIAEIVKQCVDKGIIKDTGINIYATHTGANTLKKSNRLSAGYLLIGFESLILLLAACRFNLSSPP